MTQRLLENIPSEDLKNLISEYSANKIFLVTGKTSYVRSGAKEFIEASLGDYEYVRFSDFEENPKYEDAIRGTKIFIDSGCDLIVAIGGGSAMDTAKLISAFAANTEVDGLNIVKGLEHISKKGSPLIAIPTTAGTGSETTHFAVVYHQKKKYSVASEHIFPEAAVLNSALTMSQPKYLTACSGLDALSQATESFWSVNSTNESQQDAKEAISLLLKGLVQAVNAPDEKSREMVMKGAYLAGKAINVSKTTAAHAVSYAFTTFYSIPHGHAVFLTLPEFLEYNYGVSQDDLNDSRGSEYVKKAIENLFDLFGVESASEGKDYLKKLASSIGIELSLEKLGISNYEDKIVGNVNMERLGNNPRKISKDGLLTLLRSK